MNKSAFCSTVLLPLLAAILFGCATPTPSPTPVTVTLRIGGDDSLQPIADELAKSFHETHPYVEISMRATNASTGLRELGQGSLDLAMVARSPTAAELAPRKAKAVEIGQDAVVIVVNPDNAIPNLSHQQVTQIYAGDVIKWSELEKNPPQGADDIQVVSRESGSGTRSVFEQILMRGRRVTLSGLVRTSERDMIEYVASHPDAIGYASFSAAAGDERVRAVPIEDVAPTLEAISSNRYSLVQPLYIAVPKSASPAALEFVNFVLSGSGKKLIPVQVATPLP